MSWTDKFDRDPDKALPDPFKLEAPTLQLPSISTCGNCAHFVPFRNEITGRIHPSKKGDCGWPVPQIVWPMAYQEVGLGGQKRSPRFTAHKLWPNTNAVNCLCFTPK